MSDAPPVGSDEQSRVPVAPLPAGEFRRSLYGYYRPSWDDAAREAFYCIEEPGMKESRVATLREHFDQLAHYDPTIHACMEMHRHGRLDEADTLKMALLENARETARLQRALLAALERERFPMMIYYPTKSDPR